MGRYRMWRKRAGTWSPQNTLGFHVKVNSVWKLVEHIFEKQEGAWVEVYDATFDSDFEADLADGESITVTSAGTLRLTAIGKNGRGGDGGRGGIGGETVSTRRGLFRRPKRKGGGGGGGGGGSRSTGATAISDVSVVPDDVISRTDTATHVQILHNAVVVASAENGKTGANGARGADGDPGRGAKGGKGGKGGSKGLAEESIGNAGRTDGEDGRDGETGGTGETPYFPWSGTNIGRSGTGGRGYPNDGKTRKYGFTFGGAGQSAGTAASAKIEVVS